MIVLMMATSFLTSRQMLARSKKSGQQLDSAQATTQKVMVYGMPLFFGVIGVNFQMGVLLYWLTTNVWTFGQQYFVIKAMGDDPEAVVRERKAKESGGKGDDSAAPGRRGDGADLRRRPWAGQEGRRSPHRRTATATGRPPAGPIPAAPVPPAATTAASARAAGTSLVRPG